VAQDVQRAGRDARRPTVAMNELAKQCPAIGERIGVKYVGKVDGRGGSSYHAYRVQVDRGDVGAVNWAKYSDETSEVPVSDVPGDGAEFVAQLTDAPKVDARADDDIPF
jgi:hypothetical protein